MKDDLYFNENTQRAKKRKPRAHSPSDWIFAICAGLFSLGGLAIFLIYKFNHIWNIDIDLNIDKGVEWFILFVSIVFGLVAIGFTISIISRMLLNSKLRKAEKSGYETTGKVYDFKRETSSTIYKSRSRSNSKIKVDNTYTYYAKIEFITQEGETIKFTEYTPFTKEEMNQLLELKDVNIKVYKDVCVLAHDFSLNNYLLTEDYVKEINSKKLEKYHSSQEDKKIDYNTSSLYRNKANIRASIFLIILMMAMIIGTLLLPTNPTFLIFEIITNIPIFIICLFAVLYIIRCKRNCDCIKHGVKQKAKSFELGANFPLRIVLTFTNTNGEEKTYAAHITKHEYARLKDAQEIYALVYKNYAFPDFNELEKHIKEIK